MTELQIGQLNECFNEWVAYTEYTGFKLEEMSKKHLEKYSQIYSCMNETQKQVIGLMRDSYTYGFVSGALSSQL